jgi:hypothetical protein
VTQFIHCSLSFSLPPPLSLMAGFKSL